MLAMRNTVWLLGAAVGIFCLSTEALFGIVVVGDPNDPSTIVTAPSQFDMVGHLGDPLYCTTGVLIDAWHVLTAKHYVKNRSAGTFYLDLTSGKKSFGWVQSGVHYHPDDDPNDPNDEIDLAVVTLAKSTALPGYGLYGTDPNAPNEVGQNAIVVGYGMSGTPWSVDWGGDPNYPRGTKRKGENKIPRLVETVLPGGEIIQYLQIDFDPSFMGGLPGEAMPGAGDSGGPLLLESAGKLLIAGINHDIEDWSADTRCPNFTDRARAVRVRPYLPWLQTLLFTPEPGDANYDAHVDLLDYNVLCTNYLKSGDVTWGQADFDNDHKVTLKDFNCISVNFGNVQGVAGASGQGATPEPTVACLLMAGGLALLGRRRKK